MELVDSGPLTEPQRQALEGGEENPFGVVGLDLQWRRPALACHCGT